MEVAYPVSFALLLLIGVGTVVVGGIVALVLIFNLPKRDRDRD